MSLSLIRFIHQSVFLWTEAIWVYLIFFQHVTFVRSKPVHRKVAQKLYCYMISIAGTYK